MGRRFAPRRAAETFATLLEQPGGAQARHDPAYDDLLRLVAQLREVAPPSPDPAFTAGLRDRLLAEADAALLPQPRRERATSDGEVRRRLTLTPAPHRERRFATALGGLAMVGAAASVSVLAQAAVPGDLLYPLKRGIEDARTSLAVGAQSTGDRLLADAAERLDEAQALSRRTDADPALTEQALGDFSTQARDGADELLGSYRHDHQRSAIRTITTFTGTSMDSLAALAARTPPAAQDELAAAVDTLVDIDDEALAACPGCGGPGITEIPKILLASVATPLPQGPLGLPTTAPGRRPHGSHTQAVPSTLPSELPGPAPTGAAPTRLPTNAPTGLPTALPTQLPTQLPTRLPTGLPTGLPSALPTKLPTVLPSTLPSSPPTLLPSSLPTLLPSSLPTVTLSVPTLLPSLQATTLVPTVSLPGLGQGGSADRPNALPGAETTPLP